MRVYFLFDFYIANNNLKAVEMHLKAGYSPNREVFGEYLPLAIASFLEHNEMYELLIKYGADITLLDKGVECIKNSFEQ